MRILILFIMLFLHLVDDYYLQGVFAKMKQKKWWEDNVNDPILLMLYKNDYKVALVEHAFSWTFMIMLPTMICMFYTGNYMVSSYCVCFIINLIIHAWVDHLKANVQNYSLLTDQTTHVAQVFATWTIVFYGFNLM